MISADRSRFDLLYCQNHSWLKDLLYKRLNCSQTAADLAQDTFIRILTKESLPPIENPRAYISTIAKGLTINYWRRQAIEKAYLDTLSSLPEAFVPSLEEQILVVESLTKLSLIVDGLSCRDKQIFLLARIDGLKYQQIADRMCISLSAVQKAMSRAMLRCYRMLNDD